MSLTQPRLSVRNTSRSLLNGKLHNHQLQGVLLKRQEKERKGRKRKNIKSPGTKYMQNLFSNEGLIGLPLKSGYVKNCPFHS